MSEAPELPVVTDRPPPLTGMISGNDNLPNSVYPRKEEDGDM